MFFELIIKNWEKNINEINFEKKSYYSMINSSPNIIIVNKPPIDYIIFRYLKYISNMVEKSYFIFILKFIILLRQFLDKAKKESINSNFINESNKNLEYTQL